MRSTTLSRSAENERARETALLLARRGCRRCGGYGFTGAAGAIEADGTVHPAIAFRDGVACECAAGDDFAADQVCWVAGDNPPVRA